VIANAAPLVDQRTDPLHLRLEQCGLVALSGVSVSVLFSIAIAQSLLAIAVLCWFLLLIVNRERFEVPRWFWPLLAYAVATIASAVFSPEPRLGLIDSKQLLLFLVVPLTYRFAAAGRGSLILTLIMTFGAASAAYGIFQYGLLHYDELSRRPQGTLGHYMTYSGLLMLVVGIAIAKLLFGRGERLWAALVMPALVLAIALTSTRTAWVGVCAGTGVLLVMKDFRLLAALPVAAAITFAVAGPAITHRLMSTFDSNDPTRRDRVAMLHEGALMIRDHPWVGVGPDRVKEVYSQYRVPEAVQEINPHLHNVPVQIAAERGLPALACWLAFIGLLGVDVLKALRSGKYPVLAAAALASVVSMLAAGFFEYNFGDSEFLMLFLVLITLPFAAGRSVALDPVA
jgi:putative inorganic carbon (HCO3(-)) transporter